MGLSYSGNTPHFHPSTNSHGDIVKWHYAAFALLSSGFDSRYLQIIGAGQVAETRVRFSLSPQKNGSVAEWTNAAVSKTAVASRRPEVRILPLPIDYCPVV